MPLLKKSLLASALLLLPIAALANQGTHYYNTVNEAKSMVTESLANPNVTNFDVNQYCKDAACKEAVANPAQAKYFGNDEKMVNDGQLELNNNENASNLQDGFNDRPKHKLDLNDPAYRRAQGYMDDAYNISHGISSKYHDCESGQVCDIDEQPRVCTRPTGNPIKCERVPIAGDTVLVEHSSTHRLTQNTTSSLKASQTAWREDAVLRRIHIPAINGKGIKFKEYNLTIGGKKIAVSPGNWKDCKSVGGGIKYCKFTIPTMTIEWNSAWTSPDMILTYANSTGSTIKINTPSNNIILDWDAYDLNMKWEEHCPPHPSECERFDYQPWQCVEEGGTREVNGINVTLDCWRYTRKTTCIASDTCIPLLTPTDSTMSCVELNQSCKVNVSNTCLINNVNLKCEVQECYDQQLVCGEQSFCLDGDCYVGEGEENPNFSTAVSGLAGAAEAAESLNADTLQIFTGKPASCSKKPIGLSDCCADDGWGNDIGLTDCSSEEKGLMEAKKKGLTIDLGEYCAEKVLGVCIRKKKGYCQFDSKMARIIQEQGRVQLAVGFGSAKHPNCTGITPEQLQLVDFSKVDFSDFYEDLDANLNLPDMDEITDRIKDKYQDK